MTETFEQMALRIANEVLGPHEFTPDTLDMVFATRLRVEWLKQCAGNVDAVWAKFCGNHPAEITDYERELIQAGAASREARIAELEKELTHIQKASIDALGIGLVDVSKFPFVASMKEQAK